MLRDYQQNAVDYAITWLAHKPGVPAIIVLPTGSGKSHCIAALAEHYYNQPGKQRVAIIAHRKELLEQNAGKLSIPHGYYSASLGEKDTDSQVIVGGIQSIYNKDCLAPFDVIIVDEAHRVINGEDGRYWQFIKRSPGAKLIGMTATPYRMKGGKLAWGEVVYSIAHELLVKQGYLAPIINKVKAKLDLSKIRITAGDYNEAELSEYMEDPALIEAAVKNIIAYSSDRHSILIFCVSVAHAKLLTNAMQANGLESAYLYGETPRGERERILTDFKAGKLRHLLNVEILLEGFDCPAIDMLVCLRPTKSKGLRVQMMGRGVRIAEGKENCLLIDMGGNLMEHGGIDEPYREPSRKENKKDSGRICPQCESWCKATAAECQDCGYVFLKEDPHKANHHDKPDMESKTVSYPLETYMVTGVSYREHKSKKGNVTLRIDYACPEAKYGSVSDYLNPFHENDWVRNKVHKFFKERGHMLASDTNSYSMEDLLWHAEHMKKPSEIVVDYNEKFPRIKEYKYGTATAEENGGSDNPAAIDTLLKDDFIPF